MIFTEEEFAKQIRNPLFRSGQIYSKYLAVVELNKRRVTMAKPRYVGISVLAIAKHILYWYHYIGLAKLFSSRKLLFTDTDSLCYEISNENVYEKLKLARFMDFSNFPVNHPLHSTVNYLKPGYLKDEAGGQTIKQFIGLR